MEGEVVNVGALMTMPGVFRSPQPQMQVRTTAPLVPSGPVGMGPAGQEAVLEDTYLSAQAQLAPAAVAVAVEVTLRKPFRVEWMDLLEAVGAGAAAGVSTVRVFLGMTCLGTTLNPVPVASWAAANTNNKLSGRTIQAGEIVRFEFTRTAAPGGIVVVDYFANLKGKSLG